MTAAEEVFQKKLSNLGDDIKSFIHDKGNLKKYIESCRKAARNNQAESPVLSSEYDFLSSFACICYLIENDVDIDILEEGVSLIDKACEVIPDDREYNLYRLMYSAFDVENADAAEAFDILQKLNAECPSFRLLKNNLIDAEFAEDRFFDLLSKFLPTIVDQLMSEGQFERCKSGCEMLLSLPGPTLKLKAYTYLSRILFDEKNYDEALRSAKLGVELLGSNVMYDFRDEASVLWGECWTRVAECNRINEEYDFAMSLFEKGESLGIVDCIRHLGEMYDKGQSEDVDHGKAQEYYIKAEKLQSDRDVIVQAEKEKAEREERERQDAIRKTLEERERQNAIHRLKAENKKKKVAAWAFIGVFSCLIIAAVIYLCTTTTKDKIYQYEQQGNAILAYQDSDSDPLIIFMDSNFVYVDCHNRVNKVLSVGAPLYFVTANVSATPNGAVMSLDKSPSPLCISSSKNCFVTPIPGKDAFILSSSGNQNVYYNSDVEDCYLVSFSGDSRAICRIEHGTISDDGICIEVEGNYADYLAKYYSNYFSKPNLSLLKKYGKFNTDIMITPQKNGAINASISGDITFPELYVDVVPKQLGNKENLKWFIDDSEALLSGRLTSAHVSKIFNTSDKLEYHDSNDGKSTFVIRRTGDADNPYGLFVIDNATRVYSLVDQGEKVSFGQSSIHVAKHKAVLLIFSRTKEIYYDYNGYRI